MIPIRVYGSNGARYRWNLGPYVFSNVDILGNGYFGVSRSESLAPSGQLMKIHPHSGLESSHEWYSLMILKIRLEGLLRSFIAYENQRVIIHDLSKT